MMSQALHVYTVTQILFSSSGDKAELVLVQLYVAYLTKKSLCYNSIVYFLLYFITILMFEVLSYLMTLY